MVAYPAHWFVNWQNAFEFAFFFWGLVSSPTTSTFTSGTTMQMAFVTHNQNLILFSSQYAKFNQRF